MDLLYNLASLVSHSFGSDSILVRVARPWAEQFIRWSVGDDGLAWEVNGTSCRIDPRFRAQFAPNYDQHLAQLLRYRVRPGQTCLDVGANIGVWVIQFATWVGPKGQVIAFEPNPSACKILAEHVRLNQLERNVRVEPVAVGSLPGNATLFAFGADGMSRIGEPNPLLADDVVAITVPMVTLDTWCQENQLFPDWLFIDVEGFEAAVLAGAAQTVRDRGAALGIIVEMHPELWSSSGITREEVATQIAALNRRAVPLSGQADWLGEYGHVLLELF